MHVQDFLQNPGVIFDVRSPGEFFRGRIPGSFNLPLLTDEERASVGTLYKKQGKEQAFDSGLAIVGHKLAGFVQQGRRLASDGTARILCWRGGMRSSSVAWLFRSAGIQTHLLEGGYKSFRRWVLFSLKKPLHILVLGGLTGTGKTATLQELSRQGQQILDLEHLASHRGSSFGTFGMPPQDSQEQFENSIAFAIQGLDPERPIWIEDESRMIGALKIPEPLFDQMQRAPLIVLERPLEQRISRLLEDYGSAPKENLIEATKRISKKLGGDRTQKILRAIESNDLESAIELVLYYYDKSYTTGLMKRDRPPRIVQVGGKSLEEITSYLLSINKYCCA